MRKSGHLKALVERGSDSLVSLAGSETFPTTIAFTAQIETEDAYTVVGQPLSNLQPTLALTQTIAMEGTYPSDPDSGDYTYLGEIHHFPYNFAPRGYATTSGQLVSIAQNTALFSLLGTTYGGNGTTTFALPDLGGQLSVNFGQGPGLSARTQGETFGSETIQFSASQMPLQLGGGMPFNNFQPTLATNFMINADGVMPSSAAGSSAVVGMVFEFGGTSTPSGMIPCDGRVLSIAQYGQLFQVIGTTYGGNGVTTFAVPDLRGRTIVGAGDGPGTSGGTVGTVSGQEYNTLSLINLPTNMGGTAVPIDNQGPTLALSYIITLQGIFPSRNGALIGPETESAAGTSAPYLGEIFAFAGATPPQGFVFAAGQVLSIAQNTALFSLLGTTFGGNGQTTFALPDLRGRSIVGASGTMPVGTATGSETATITSSNIPSLNYAGTESGETLYGGSFDDMINGLGGNDTLYFNLGGDDAGNGGDGDDIFYYGAALTSADVNDGGAGSDTLVIQGAGDFNLSATNLTNIEGISLQSASITRWGQAGLGSYDYLLAMNDANVGAGQQLRVNAQSLLAGEDFTFDGSAETNGRFLVYGGHGNDTLTGGVGNDIFFFEAGRFESSADRVIGGAGNDAVVISGSTAASPSLLTLYIAPGSFTGVESLSFNGRFASDTAARPSYEIYFADGNIAAGAALIVNGSSLTATQYLHFNGSGETQGRFTMYGGAGQDVLVGGANNDTFYAGGGADSTTGGAGADTFQVRAALDSTVAASDQIEDFQSGLDKIDLRAIDAASGTDGNQAFAFIGDTAFGGVAGQLRATYDAGLSRYTIQGDTDGDGIADLQIFVTSSQLLGSDFML